MPWRRPGGRPGPGRRARSVVRSPPRSRAGRVGVVGAEPVGGKISRRSMLSRGLVAGGIVWAAPVISSVPAYAGGKGGPKKGTVVPCTAYYAVRFTLKGIAPLGSGDVCPEIAAFVRDHGDLDIQYPGAKVPQL